MNKYKLLTACLTLFSAVGVNALESIDDEVLSDMTGQSGVTVEFETNSDLTIDEARYNDADGVRGEASYLSLENIAIASGTRNKIDVDVTEEGRLLVQLYDIQQGDLTVGKVSFSGQSIGSLAVRNMFFDPTGSFNLSVGQITTNDEFDNPDTRGAVIFNFAFKNSRFDVEWTEDNRTISQTIQYDDFVVEDIATSVESREGRAWARMDVAGITGNMRIEDISLGSGAGSVLGTVGFGGLTVDPNSFVSITGH